MVRPLKFLLHGLKLLSEHWQTCSRAKVVCTFYTWNSKLWKIHTFNGEKLKLGKQLIVAQLTQTIARMENGASEYKQFNIFNSNEENVHYFSRQEIHQCNPSTVNIFKLKQKLIKIIKQQGKIGTFENYESRLKGVWRAVLKENYVFHFKNAVETSVYVTHSAKRVL